MRSTSGDTPSIKAAKAGSASKRIRASKASRAGSGEGPVMPQHLADSGLARARYVNRTKGYEVLVSPCGQGTSVTFVLLNDEKQTPIEVRVLAVKFDDFDHKGFAPTVENWTPPERHGALLSQDVRAYSLAHALADLRSMSGQAAEAEEEFPAAALTLSVGGRPAMGFRTIREYEATMNRIIAARLYAGAVQAKDPRPAVTVAGHMKKSTEQVRGLLAQARKAGYLQSVGKGVSGGRLTSKGEQLWSDLTKAYESKKTEQK